MRCFGINGPLCLDAFNILELSNLTTAPFSRPGGAAYSLGVSAICQARNSM